MPLARKITANAIIPILIVWSSKYKKMVQRHTPGFRQWQPEFIADTGVLRATDQSTACRPLILTMVFPCSFLTGLPGNHAPLVFSSRSRATPVFSSRNHESIPCCFVLIDTLISRSSMRVLQYPGCQFPYCCCSRRIGSPAISDRRWSSQTRRLNWTG